MYLDIVRLYTATKETGVAAETLAEFEGRFADAPQYPEVALKLADSYIAAGKTAEEQALYQRLLDHLGKRRKKSVPLVPSSAQPQTSTAADGQIANGVGAEIVQEFGSIGAGEFNLRAAAEIDPANSGS